MGKSEANIMSGRMTKLKCGKCETVNLHYMPPDGRELLDSHGYIPIYCVICGEKTIMAEAE